MEQIKKGSKQLLQQLQLDYCQTPIISVVGAGGKTSVICELAKEYQMAGKSVVVMTTTHMRRPWRNECFLEADKKNATTNSILKFKMEIQDALETGGIIWVGSLAEDDKIGSIEEVFFQVILEQNIPVLIEADGAKELPLKAPESFEPVILPQTTCVINVYGMDAIGQKLAACAHRPQRVSQILQKNLEQEIREEDIVKLALSNEGGRKNVNLNMDYHIILNKADTEERKASAETIKKDLSQNEVWIEKIHITSFSRHEAVLVLAAGMGKRFGDNKLLKQYAGKPIYQYMIHNMEQMQECQRVIVTRTLEIKAHAGVAGITTVHNDHPELGISHSLQIGLLKCLKEDPFLERVVVCVCDQPKLKVKTIKGLLEMGRLHGGKIVCASVENKKRNPVLWNRRFFSELLAITGDVGGRQVIEKHQQDVLLYEIDESEVRDIDYPQDIIEI